MRANLIHRVPELQLQPTRGCNLACAHCCTSSGPELREAVDLETLTRCLTDATVLGYRRLTVSGGEPLLYPALAGLLARARALGMWTTVISNGMLATPARWGPLAPLIDEAVISIDGPEAEHDALRRRPGAFTAAVGNLATIRASGVPFAFAFTLTQHNVESLAHVVRLAAEHGACRVQVHPLAPHGRAAIELAGAQPDAIELAFAAYEAMRLGRGLGIAVSVDAFTPEQLAGERDALVPVAPVTDLVDVAPVLVVEPDARVVPLSLEVSPRLALGSLIGSRLTRLAGDWLSSGRGDVLADACARTWAELMAAPAAPAVSWYGEVAARTWPAVASSWRIPAARA